MYAPVNTYFKRVYKKQKWKGIFKKEKKIPINLTK